MNEGAEDEEVARISEATPDLLATTTIRQRRNSRSSLLDEIVQKVEIRFHPFELSERLIP